MKNAIAVIAVSSVLAGCSTAPLPFSQAKPAPGERVLAFGVKPSTPYGTIVVVRDNGFATGGCFVAINVDTASRPLESRQRKS